MTRVGMSAHPSSEDMEDWLVRHGFYVGDRDYRVNSDHAGEIMVIDTETRLSLIKTGLAFPDAGGLDGGWCIVGDDRDDLMLQTYSFHCNG